MKIKKIPYFFLIGSFAMGASLILGFLSFTGALALWASVSVASISFVLSVGYEGEIYLKNIQGALDKLGFKGNFMHRILARRYLYQHAPRDPAEQDFNFFKDYIKLLKIRDSLNRKGPRLNKEDRQRKKDVEKAIKRMEKWFAVLLFKEREPLNEEEQKLLTWLSQNEQAEWLEKANRQSKYYPLIAMFSAISGLSMSFGTTYLLLGALSSVPAILAVSPVLLTVGVATASLVAGAAYGLLMFNTTTDLLDKDRVQEWIRKFRDNFQKPTLRSVSMNITAILLFSLAMALTICTAGTWWTVIKHTQPLFRWMAKIPTTLLMAFPIINGAASLSFNFENTSESFELVDKMVDSDVMGSAKKQLAKVWKNLKHETFWQKLNPFRLILKLTLTPLRILLFLGHLVSIALTSDRLPGVPQIVSFLVGLICEGFEDAHYFLTFNNHSHNKPSNGELLEEQLEDDGDHSHVDLPTRFLNLIFMPLFYAAAYWDYGFSKEKDKAKSFDKFNLSTNDIHEESIEPVEIKASEQLSRLGMDALKQHIQSTFPAEMDATKRSDLLVQRKLGFFGNIEPLIRNENEYAAGNEYEPGADYTSRYA